MKNSDYILFLDMDGVLVDYSSGWWAVAKQIGLRPLKDKTDEYTKEDLAPVYKQTRNPEFWESLGWEHGGRELWRKANDLFEHVHILTSTAAKEDEKLHKIIKMGKLTWCEAWLAGVNLGNVHVVNSGDAKADFASQTTILVDDRKSTIDSFNKAGGYGILHDARKYHRTLDELEDIARPLNLGEIAKRLPFVRRQFWSGK